MISKSAEYKNIKKYFKNIFNLFLHEFIIILFSRNSVKYHYNTKFF